MGLKVLGITSGIGSLQYGFKKVGFQVLPSHEWRPYYHTGTFEKNFNVYLEKKYLFNPEFKDVDCIVSHPECGNYSNLYTGKNAASRLINPSDIYQFINLTKQYKPKTFLVDNLPKSLLAVKEVDWVENFPDYNIFFEMVSNWGYGNVQKNRNRLFIIGVRKDLDWRFVPNESKHNKKLIDVISDIDGSDLNHKKMQLNDTTQWSGYQIGFLNKGRLTLLEMQDWFEKNKAGTNIKYFNKKNELKIKPGYGVVKINHNSPVLSGGGSFYDNHWIKDDYYRPLTMRERLRIQGFNDDFTLIPNDFNFGTKEHQSLIKQSGKCMPVQFPTEFARQLSDYLLNGITQDFKPKRLLKQINSNQLKMNF